MRKRHSTRGGFALPTVLIASVVMLTILAVSVSSVAAVRNSLKAQYYEQLAKAAGEAGVAYAKACLAKNANVPLWSDDKPLTPATDCAGNLLLGPAVQVLVVGGGGGGGAGIGGGGGGGGVTQQDSVPISKGSYSVVVGAGGAGGVSKSSGSNGGDSRFDSISVAGGGGGGGRIGTLSYTPAGDGGSGGGGNGSYEATTGTGAPGGVGNTGEGNDGGMGSAGDSGSYAGNGGGGGGAGAPGGNATGVASGTGISGDGGIGFLSTISGDQVYYGAGGAGGRWGSGDVGKAGVTGGGEAGSGNAVVGGAGQANTGAGGGGGSSGDGLGGAGGSGVVYVRYANNGSITASGGSVYTSGPYKIHRFKSSATFSVSATSDSSCPSDPRCSVTVNDTLRSSFRVGMPTVDATGKAVALPNSGYVELLRASSGEVWRTYNQPAVQAAVVPDLCSGAATSPLGWSNAIISTREVSLPNATTARTITLADDDLNAGRMYFRKDFTVTNAGTYTVAARTANDQDIVEIYVDNVLRTTAQNGVATGSVNLSVGCHVITARLTNKTLLPRHSQFTAAIQQGNAEPIVATDNSWRVSAGSSVHYSDPDFYADPNVWTGVTDLYNAQSSIPGWGSSSGDDQTHLITPPCNTVCPPSSTTYFRDSRDFVLTSNTEVLVSALCDDDCTIYVDGNQVIASSPWSNINQQTLTLTAGTHHVGARLYNAGSAANPSKLAIALYDKTARKVLTRTDTSWLTSSGTWIAGGNADNDPMSYENSFRPSPLEIADPVTYDVLVVGGGGGGGGNCNTCGGAGGGGGGGVIFSQDVIASVGSSSITIGGGGAAGAGGASRTNGGNGGNTSFGSIVARGGGGGGAQLGTAGLSGGSGGGGSGGNSPAAGAGGAGIAGMGWAGGAGAPTAAFNGGGGGGAGGTGMAGSTSIGGDGGPGLISYITGTRIVVGGGGGGGAYGAVTAGEGDDDSAGDGATPSVNSGKGYAGTTNRGGGGGGANGSTVGGAGGAGGSGVVIVKFKKGSLSFTLGGSGTRTQTEVTIEGIVYTILTFTSGTSTFQISAINS